MVAREAQLDLRGIDLGSGEVPMRFVIGVTAVALLAGSASLPNGWKARVDGPDSKEDAIAVEEKESALIVTTRGVGTLLYKPDMKAEGDYELSAVFSELEPA